MALVFHTFHETSLLIYFWSVWWRFHFLAYWHKYNKLSMVNLVSKTYLYCFVVVISKKHDHHYPFVIVIRKFDKIPHLAKVLQEMLKTLVRSSKPLIVSLKVSHKRFSLTITYHTKCSAANKGWSTVNYHRYLTFNYSYLSCNDHCDR